eukprot:1012730-Rhodomonas_salina.1
MEMIYQWYKRRGFPIGFLKALSKFDCKVCALSKGARVYKHSKRVKLGKAGGQYQHHIIVSAHINDTLMACESTETMAAFKKAFLTRFEGTDEGE